MGKAFITFIIVLLVEIIITGFASATDGAFFGLLIGLPLTGALIVYFNNIKK